MARIVSQIAADSFVKCTVNIFSLLEFLYGKRNLHAKINKLKTGNFMDEIIRSLESAALGKGNKNIQY